MLGTENKQANIVMPLDKSIAQILYTVVYCCGHCILKKLESLSKETIKIFRGLGYLYYEKKNGWDTLS